MKLSGISAEDAKGAPPIVPAGQYVAAFIDAEETVSQSSNNPMIVVEVEILRGDQKSRSIRDYLVFTEGAKWKLAQVLVAIGREIPEGEFELAPSDLIGKTCGIVTIEEEYNGKPQAKIDRYFPLDEEVEAPTIEPKVEIPF